MTTADVYHFLRTMNYIEFIANITGIISIWYAQRNKVWVYPIGLVSVCLYVYICFHAKLYADMGVNVYYAAMSFYGWYNWRQIEKKGEGTTVFHATYTQKCVGIGFFVFAFISIYALLKQTDTDVPVLDAFTTSVALVAMWYMAKKVIESWLLWVVTDIVSMYVYAYKDLYFTVFQCVVFTILSIKGYISWRKIARSHALQHATSVANFSTNVVPAAPIVISVVGVESTGKTTLCEDLAAYYGTVYVPEYAREYLEKLDRPYVEEDLLIIAKGQWEAEQQAMAVATKGVVITDTNLLHVKIWAEWKYNTSYAWVEHTWQQAVYTHYFLTTIGFDWVYDPQREAPSLAERKKIHAKFEEYLKEKAAPSSLTLLKGSREERKAQAIEVIEKIN